MEKKNFFYKIVIQLQVLVNYARSAKEAEEVSREVSLNHKCLTEMLCFSFLDPPCIMLVEQLDKWRKETS